MSADAWKICPRCRAELDSMIETFREDYEIRIDETGNFAVDYYGGCDKCGLKHTFKHSEKVSVTA